MPVDAPSLAPGPDGRPRCWWSVGTPDYVAYHDEEWGRPVRDDRALYEKLTLEAFQSGLSWLTILRKRENFRAAFDGFEFEKVARYGARDVERLMNDAGIVRNRAKIDAAITNAKATAAMKGGLTELIWSYKPSALRTPHSALRTRPPVDDRRVKNAGKRAQETRLRLRRPHHGLLHHAGLRCGERPHRRLLRALVTLASHTRTAGRIECCDLHRMGADRNTRLAV
jgi:DNA-3-methyladenine glycosylase I